MKLTKNIIEEFAKKYSEEYLFDVIGKKIRERGYLIFDEFYEICMWKSSRPKNYFNKNTPEEIYSITKEAIKEKNEELKMEKLCTLHGVGIPTASAILTIIDPEKYAVIDIRCLTQLEELNYKIKPGYISIKKWINYIEIMRKIGKENNLSPRTIDKALFAMHRENQKNNEKLYHSKK